jgi:hypothetical protein
MGIEVVIRRISKRAWLFGLFHVAVLHLADALLGRQNGLRENPIKHQAGATALTRAV